MFLAFLTLFTALAISAVAIFYSVAGLATIFAAAAIPIIIMGGILESAKLVTAVWLHRYWHRCVWWLKTYLVLAVAVLMFITSMGIFGYLSRAHIEQTSLNIEQAVQSQQLTEQVERVEGRIARWNEELDRLFSGSDVRVDSLLSREQDELNSIYARIEREKTQLRQDAQNNINIQNNRLEQAQSRRDQNIANARSQFADDPVSLNEAIQRASSTEVSVAAAVQREIIAINRVLSEQLDIVDTRFETQINDVQARINQLRSQSTNRTDEIDQRISQLENLILQEQAVLTDLRQERAAAEREFRMLEAEVGPIKYIAEFIYRESADKELLEEAVRWVIIIIIIVFDPLAVLLLIASQFTFHYVREDKIANGIKVKNSKIDELFGLVDPITKQTVQNTNHVEESTIVKKTEPEVATIPETANDATSGTDPVDHEEQTSVDPVDHEEQTSVDPVDHNETVSESTEITDPLLTDDAKAEHKEVQTEGITFVETCDGYVKYKDTLVQKEAFKNQHSEMWKSFNATNTGFGTQFPKIAKIGDMFVRVDMIPNRVYKFEGTKWIEVNKNQSDTYLFDEEYIQHLITKIESGEYDVELLSENERLEIEEYLRSQNT